MIAGGQPIKLRPNSDQNRSATCQFRVMDAEWLSKCPWRVPPNLRCDLIMVSGCPSPEGDPKHWALVSRLIKDAPTSDEGSTHTILSARKEWRHSTLTRPLAALKSAPRFPLYSSAFSRFRFTCTIPRSPRIHGGSRVWCVHISPRGIHTYHDIPHPAVPGRDCMVQARFQYIHQWIESVDFHNESRLCELGHSLTVSHAVYTVTVTQYGRPQELVRTPNSLNAAILFSGFVGPIVQVYLAWSSWTC